MVLNSPVFFAQFPILKVVEIFDKFMHGIAVYYIHLKID